MWGQAMEDDLEQLQKIFGKVSRVDAQYEVHRSAKIYPNGSVRLFVAKQPYTKNIPFMESQVDELDNLVEDWATHVEITTRRQIDNQIRSLRRSRTLIRDYAISNDFELFATFTFSPKKSDRFNPDAVKLQMANWLRNQRNRNGRFKYLVVPEFHHDRKALHFHALLGGYKGELVEVGKSHKGRKIYYFKSYTLGHNTALKIDNLDAVSRYLCKYISKDMPQFRDKRRFWMSLNLERPRVVDNPDMAFVEQLGDPTWEHENEYGWIFYFERKRDSEELQAS